jgi:very-short-patch-repair endonuclease
MEEMLWAALRNRQIEGLKFRRQHPVASFVLDFYAAELKLAVEIERCSRFSRATGEGRTSNRAVECDGYHGAQGSEHGRRA